MPSFIDKIGEAERHAKQVNLTCSCVNWMGGCKQEYSCDYGHVLQLRKALAELRNAAPALMDAIAAAKELCDAKDAVAANYMCSEQRLELAEAALRSKLAKLEEL